MEPVSVIEVGLQKQIPITYSFNILLKIQVRSFIVSIKSTEYLSLMGQLQSGNIENLIGQNIFENKPHPA